MRTPLASEELTSASRPYFCARESLDHVAALNSSAASLSGLAVGAYRRDQPDFGLTKPNTPSEAFAATIYLRELPRMNRWRNGSLQPEPTRRVGDLRCLDMRHGSVSDVTHPVYTFVFVPQKAFDKLAGELSAHTVTQLTPSGAEAWRDCRDCAARAGRRRHLADFVDRALWCVMRAPIRGTRECVRLNFA
jgi:hypothetical protein